MRHQEGCYAYSTGVTQFRTAHVPNLSTSVLSVGGSKTSFCRTKPHLTSFFDPKPTMTARVSVFVWGWRLLQETIEESLSNYMYALEEINYMWHLQFKVLWDLC